MALLYIRNREGNGETPKEEILEDWPGKLKSVHIELGSFAFHVNCGPHCSLVTLSLLPFHSHITKRDAIII